MSGIDNVCKELARLPYADMKALGDAVAQEFDRATANDGSVYSGTRMADALSKVGKEEVPQSPISDQEEKLFKRIFKRKRTMTIQPDGKGWKVKIDTLSVHVRGLTLRDAVNTILDQVVVAQALDGEIFK